MKHQPDRETFVVVLVATDDPLVRHYGTNAAANLHNGCGSP